jgi:hypothetical protein
VCSRGASNPRRARVNDPTEVGERKKGLSQPAKILGKWLRRHQHHESIHDGHFRENGHVSPSSAAPGRQTRLGKHLQPQTAAIDL